MQKLNKWIPLFIVIISIGIFATLISRNESILARGQSIFVSLQPVDPRSILQGDYMALRYELNIKGSIPEARRLKAYVKLNALGVVAETRFNIQNVSHTGDWSALLLKQVPHQNSLYPVANSFLFAEGLADCYSKAKFAEFKVTKIGDAILYRLTDEHLKSLRCEEQQRWMDGSSLTE